MDPRLQILIEQGLLREEDVRNLELQPGESEVDSILRLGLISETAYREAMAKVYVALPPDPTQAQSGDQTTGAGETNDRELQDILRDLSEENTDTIDIADDTSPAIATVERMLRWGFGKGVAALCLEPREQAVYVRARVAGSWVACQEFQIPRHVLPAITARLKIIANLDISERRLPQRGIIKLAGEPVKSVMVDFLPTTQREEIMIHYCQPQVTLLYADLGLPVSIAAHIEDVMAQGRGMILATGPTQQGRIATLYAIAEHFIVPPRKLVTVELSTYRPLPLATQVELNSACGFTYPFAIKTAQRHCPDVLLVSEVADHESAELLIKGASEMVVLTRMIPDTPYHTIMRFLDMGFEPMLVAYALRLLLSQRRVRTLCPHCKLPTGDSRYPFRANGCSQCLGNGFIGCRTVFAAVWLDEEIQDLIRHYLQSEQNLKQSLFWHAQPSLRESALALAAQGVTSCEEAVRTTPPDDVNFL
jgi:type II secretory ATPase GspE/PulE/Tfp pilus assembly ATPase PilB-like protein